MTHDEAIKRLECYKPFIIGDEWKETYDIAIDVLKKRIPISVKIDKRLNAVVKCPTCGVFVGTNIDDRVDIMKYCSECGQLLKGLSDK